MNWLFCGDSQPSLPGNTQLGRELAKAGKRSLPFTDTDAYRNIKAATEAFVMANCGVFPEFTELDSQYVMDQRLAANANDSRGLFREIPSAD